MKTILTLLVGLSTLITSAQGITEEYLVGRWEQDDKTGFIMYFSIDASGELNCNIISAATGNRMKVLKAKIEVIFNPYFSLFHNFILYSF